MEDEMKIESLIKVKMTVLGCARCGQNHEMEFNKFSGNPIKKFDGALLTHWGLCPVNGEPVLMAFIKSDQNYIDPDKPEIENFPLGH